MGKPIIPHGSKRGRGCPRKIFVGVDRAHDFGGDDEDAPRGVSAGANGIDADGYDTHFGAIDAAWVDSTGWRRVAQADAKALQVTEAEVDPSGCGIGTRLYEALSKVACARGVPFRSDSQLKPDAEGFWKKQVRKGRAVQHGNRYVIESPCKHAHDLSGVRRKKGVR